MFVQGHVYLVLDLIFVLRKMVMNKIHFHNKFIYPIHEVKEEVEEKQIQKFQNVLLLNC